MDSLNELEQDVIDMAVQIKDFVLDSVVENVSQNSSDDSEV